MFHSRGTSKVQFKPSLTEILAQLHQSNWRTSVVHIFRETNHLLARQGHVSYFDWTIVNVCSPGLGMLLADDHRGSSLPRLVAYYLLFCCFYVFLGYKKKVESSIPFTTLTFDVKPTIKFHLYLTNQVIKRKITRNKSSFFLNSISTPFSLLLRESVPLP